MGGGLGSRGELGGIAIKSGRNVVEQSTGLDAGGDIHTD